MTATGGGGRVSMCGSGRYSSCAVADAAIKTELRTFVDFPSWAISRAATAADVVVIGRESRGARADGYWLADAGDILVSAGRPVLVVPPGIIQPKFGHALIDTTLHVLQASRKPADLIVALGREGIGAFPGGIAFHVQGDPIQARGERSGEDEAEQHEAHGDPQRQ